MSERMSVVRIDRNIATTALAKAIRQKQMSGMQIIRQRCLFVLRYVDTVDTLHVRNCHYNLQRMTLNQQQLYTVVPQ